ncbi:hypothetical protein LOK49_LG03G00260 [Camellia lanceoleosa]|uniref:Uncharacterized protein n=1 Tax=Camellia lanceoleosa TaxID=1840588 RepID=A0ACC0ID67_9ERIC|nr:hypothetical protein LOK49_LG03G00260 [Camellia lanceoleosa]
MNSFELKVAKPESNEAFVESVVAIEKSPVGIAETRSDGTRERESYKEMEVGRRKRITWESRMKSDELNGGLKIFHGEEENSEESGDKSLRPKPSLIGVSGKRKTWKSENSDGLERSAIQIARQRSEINKNLDVQCKELSVSTDGIKKNPVQSKKSRSEQLSVSVNGIERSPIHKMNSFELKVAKPESNEAFVESVVAIEKSPVGIAETRSDRGCKQEQSKSRDLEYRRTLRLAFAGPDWNLKLRYASDMFPFGRERSTFSSWKRTHDTDDHTSANMVL